ncbi:MAG: deoxyribose-phosphate aldolase [Geothermobacteraceae bacterium]
MTLDLTAVGGPAPLIDHTLLRPTANVAEIEHLCEEAVEYGFASVCVPPCHVRLAAGRLYGSGVAVSTVVGFPLGFSSPEVKRFEAVQAVNDGAVELDMVIRQDWAAQANWQAVGDEIALLVRAVPEAKIKVILECCRLMPDSITALVDVVADSGAAFVKTSTGFAEKGADAGQVRLMAQVARGRVGVKAAGGIRTLDDLVAMVTAGAKRIGTSAGVAIMRQWLERQA